MKHGLIGLIGEIAFAQQTRAGEPSSGYVKIGEFATRMGMRISIIGGNLVRNRTSRPLQPFSTQGGTACRRCAPLTRLGGDPKHCKAPTAPRSLRFGHPLLILPLPRHAA